MVIASLADVLIAFLLALFSAAACADCTVDCTEGSHAASFEPCTIEILHDKRVERGFE